MSATISGKVMMKEVLKATGFDCPQGMENKTFEEATSSSGSGGGGDSTYAHKVEIKFTNYFLSYQGSGQEIIGFNFDKIADNSLGSEVSTSGDTQELLNFCPFIMKPGHYPIPYTKDFKPAYHLYLKDSDTENIVQGLGLYGYANTGERAVGILFQPETTGKNFNNTIVLEWT